MTAAASHGPPIRAAPSTRRQVHPASMDSKSRPIRNMTPTNTQLCQPRICAVRKLMWNRLCDHSRLSSTINAIMAANSTTPAPVTQRLRGSRITSAPASRVSGRSASQAWWLTTMVTR